MKIFPETLESVAGIDTHANNIFDHIMVEGGKRAEERSQNLISGVSEDSHAPSTSTQPSGNPSLSAIPSLSTYPSSDPSTRANPSTYTYPSANPSTSTHPSTNPSTSTHPSDQPSNYPTLSPRPSVIPSTYPSQAPSFIPSKTSSPGSSPSILPSKSPSKKPTKSPVAQPTGSPVESPTPVVKCKDSRVRFRLDIDHKVKKRSCKWVGQNSEKIDTRCGLENVDSHCPLTCGACSEYKCADSKKVWFPKTNNEDLKDVNKRCTWVGKNASKKDRRCGKKGVRRTCRATCGYCSKS